MKHYRNAKYFDDYKLGEVIYSSNTRTVTETDIVNFAGLTGDFNPLHVDREYAKQEMHHEIIAHGALVFSMCVGLVSDLFNGSVIAFLGVSHDYTKATKIGDTIYVKLTVTDTRATSKPGRGIVFFDMEAINQNEEAVIKGSWKLLFKTRPVD